MADASKQYLLEIKTVLESQGLDAAKTRLDELIQKTNAGAGAEAAANKERERTQDKAEKTARAIMAMNHAMEGGMGPFRAAIHVANQLGGSFALLALKASAVGAAITVGWNIGTKLREWVTGAKDVEAEMEALKKTSKELSDRVAQLSTIRLSNLKAEADEIAKGFSTAVDKAERLKRLTDLREDAQLASDLAGVQLKFEKGDITANERDRLEIEFTAASQRRKADSEQRRITENESKSYERENQARRKFGTLSRNAGMASQEYNQTIQAYSQELKDAGISDPDAFLASGRTDLLKAKIEELRKPTRLTAMTNNYGVEHWVDAPKLVDELKRDRERARKLEELNSLKVVMDATNKDLETYRPIHDRVLNEESSNREQLSAEKDVLVSRYQEIGAIKTSKLQGVQNKITTDFDKAVEDSMDPRAKARKKSSDLLDSLKLDYMTRRDNAGLPLSPEGQKAFDASRLTEATRLGREAVSKAFNGGDPNALVAELIDALRQLNARPTLRPDQIQTILTEIKNLKGQQQASSGLN